MLELVYKKDHSMSFLTKKSVLLRYLMLTICVMSMVANIMGAAGVLEARKLDYYLSFFSICYTFWFDRNSFKRIIIVLGVIPKLIVLLLIFGMFVLVMAGYGEYTFSLDTMARGDDDYNQHYYYNYGQAVWTTFVAITSSRYVRYII